MVESRNQRFLLLALALGRRITLLRLLGLWGCLALGQSLTPSPVEGLASVVEGVLALVKGRG